MLTTVKLLIAIALAAYIGLSSPAAATGIMIELLAKAQKRFVSILRIVFLEFDS